MRKSAKLAVNMDELLTNLVVCLILIVLKMKLYSQKDLNMSGVSIWITKIYLPVMSEWGWDDRRGGSDQGKGCAEARDPVSVFTYSEVN